MVFCTINSKIKKTNMKSNSTQKELTKRKVSLQTTSSMDDKCSAAMNLLHNKRAKRFEENDDILQCHELDEISESESEHEVPFSLPKMLLKLGIKPCPKCFIPTEKNGGCNHMTCSQCATHWSWLSGLPMQAHQLSGRTLTHSFTRAKVDDKKNESNEMEEDGEISSNDSDDDSSLGFLHDREVLNQCARLQNNAEERRRNSLDYIQLTHHIGHSLAEIMNTISGDASQLERSVKKLHKLDDSKDSLTFGETEGAFQYSCKLNMYLVEAVSEITRASNSLSDLMSRLLLANSMRDLGDDPRVKTFAFEDKHFSKTFQSYYDPPTTTRCRKTCTFGEKII